MRAFQPTRGKCRGAALVLVLCFLVLLTGLVLAFLSRSILDRQISNSSANQAKVDIFAQGAVDQIIADLKQEISAGSLVTSPAAGQQVFAPRAAACAVPSRVGTGADLPNLVKRSAFGQPFFAGSSADYDTSTYPPSRRAVNANTATPSLGGRLISAARWNKPLLMQVASGTDLAPASPDFAAPDWILVGRDGSNPSAATPNPAAADFTVGRYAYAIYDEGGLLDMNAAGYPSTMATAPAVPYYKDMLAYADLTQIGLTQPQVDAVVGWRNYASTQAPGEFPDPGFTATSAENYHRFLTDNERGFLTVGQTPLHNGQSDRMFIGRQQLIKFLLEGVARGDATQKASLQNALQYLGTFSRDLNQPSLAPDPARPKIVSGNGGNDAFGGDDIVNPSFLSIRVQTGFERSDGSQAVAGEPLMKKRFVLNRLSWLTYKGPSSGRAESDVDIQALIRGGIAWRYLQLGTEKNIQAYFGLTWDAANSRWNYAQPTAGAPIKTLREVAAENREPDFLELLKATIAVGSLGKGATNPNGLSWEVLQYNQDISVDYAIVQIAANIIDQFDTDGYPCVISFDGGAGPREFVGIENLPYFYRTRTGMVMLRGPDPYPKKSSGGDPFPSQDYYGISAGPDTHGLAVGTPLKLTDPGMMAVFLQPEVWNPHDAKSPAGAPRPNASGAADLRLVVDSSLDLTNYWSIGQQSEIRKTPLTPLDYSSAALTAGTDPSPPFYNNYQPELITLTAGNTALNFSDNGGTLFREPTLLVKPGLPAGSQLSMEASNQLATIFSSDPLLSPYLHKAPNGSPCVKAVNYGNEDFCGIFLGVTPVRWVTGSGADRQVLSGWVCASPVLSSGDSPTTYRLQYRDPEGRWRTYDQKITDVLGGGNQLGWAKLMPPGEVIGQTGYAACIDPRTTRFGMPAGRAGTANYVYRFPPYQTDMYTVSGQKPRGFLDSTGTVLATQRLDANAGAGLAYSASLPITYGLPAVDGWHPGNWTSETNPSKLNLFRFGLFSQNNPEAINNGILYSSAPQQNLNPAPQGQYYSDADSVVRRAMAAYVPVTSSSVSADTVTGLPLATATSFPGTTPAPAATQSQSRPIILNRPFRSVADLGYVFSGTAWKQLDMATPESGCAGLLDVFCVRYSNDFDGLEAGRVNLNTRQVPVLKAILAGAYKDEFGASASNISGEAEAIATALVARTTSTEAGQGPLGNLSELVGKWTGNVPVAGGGIDGAKSYSGFSADLAAIYGTGPHASPASHNIQRLREASLRALVNTGTVRVWTLLIDLVAQTGRYPLSADSPDKFMVEGEQRYWVHVAIDRSTGKVIDKQVEVVKE
jgi:hypothetical protein